METLVHDETLSERDELIMNHLDLAEKIAMKRNSMVPRSVGSDELVSAAYMGLVEAANRFNGNQASFKAYAIIKINGAIIDYLREASWGARNRYFSPMSLDCPLDDNGFCLADTVEDHRAAPKWGCELAAA
jgi:RNA polymerase sigma factor for flagellar operon FliA